jgi:hypothetical protein
MNTRVHDTSKQHTLSDITKTLLAGAAARCSAAVLMFPIDVIKTRLQFQRNKPSSEVRTFYRNGWHAFRTMLKEEPISAFYRGLPVRLIYIAPSAAVSFTVYEQFKAALNGSSFEKINWTTPIITLMAGMSARVLGTAVRTPFDMLKQQMQIQGLLKDAYTPKRRGVVWTIKYISQKHGFTGFFQGYKITLLRDAPFAGIYFTTYELTKRSLSHHTKMKKPIQHLSSGAIAGAIATTMTIPVDVVKTRLQTQSSSEGLYQYKGIADAFKTIFREEGPKTFFRGLGPRLLYIIPASGLTFTFFEQFKILFALDPNAKP